MVCACNPSAREAETGKPSVLLASQSSLTGKLLAPAKDELKGILALRHAYTTSRLSLHGADAVQTALVQ